MPPVKKTKIRFVAKGDQTIVLAPGRREPIYNAVGTVLDMKYVQARELIFDQGVAQTSDENMIPLALEHPLWGNEFYWHPSSLPKDATKEEEELARAISQFSISRLKRRDEGIEKAREGSVPSDGIDE